MERVEESTDAAFRYASAGSDGAPAMRYLPIFADLAGKPALLVGGNEESARKLRLLLKTEAEIHVVAAEPVREVEILAVAGRIRLHRRPFVESDLDGVRLVIVGDAGAWTAEAISALAQGRGLPVNVVDRPELSSFIVPGIVDRDPVVIAIGSAGDAPVLVRRLRERIETLLPTRLGLLARFAGRFRGAIASAIHDGAGRRLFWERFFDGPIAADVLAGREAEANDAMLRALNARRYMPAEGSVALVGAGPGDPDLLTLKAFRLMQDADVVVHDALIGPRMLDYVRRDAVRIDVGKRAGRPSLGQDEINRILLEHARAGRRVVRLKGGDPFIFGRGGEELEFLERHGVRVEVVPGITAALGAAAATGLPLTHRDHANRLTVVTGHDRDGIAALDPHLLADRKATLVVYMGLGAAAEIERAALAAGRSPATPVAVIERATLADQRVLKGRLDGLSALVSAERVAAPALIVIGEVAGLARAAGIPVEIEKIAV